MEFQNKEEDALGIHCIKASTTVRGRYLLYTVFSLDLGSLGFIAWIKAHISTCGGDHEFHTAPIALPLSITEGLGKTAHYMGHSDVIIIIFLLRSSKPN